MYDEVLEKLVAYEEERKRRIKANRDKIENSWHKKLAIIPKKLSDGNWVKPFETYEVRYQAKRVSYMVIDDPGIVRVTDPYRHYINPDFHPTRKVLESRKIIDK